MLVAPAALDAALHLAGCTRLFIDGGSNSGDAVRSFVDGRFFGCALNGPYRLYPTDWKAATAAERRRRMALLRQPEGWCIRSFEANSAFLPPLREEEVRLRSAGHDVRFIGAALSNLTSQHAPRTITTFARNKWGSTATTLPFEDIFPHNRPAPLRTHTEMGPSYDVQDVIARAAHLNATIALKLDVEGDEVPMIDPEMEPDEHRR